MMPWQEAGEAGPAAAARERLGYLPDEIRRMFFREPRYGFSCIYKVSHLLSE